jgi:hypothetical protein
VPFEFRNPGGLWLLGLLAPLIVLYILKIRRQRLTVASTWLWQQAERDLLAKSPFRRLIVQVPLVLQALALILLALAFARPASRGTVVLGDYLAIVVDTSASMNTKTKDGTPRIAEARVAAKRLITQLTPGAQAMIIEAGREPHIASPLDRDTRRLDAAVDRIQPRDVEGQLGRAIAVASDRLRQVAGTDKTTRRIAVITDGAVADDQALSAAVLPVEVIQVGTPAENAAIVRIDVRSGVDPATKKEQVQAFALVRNYGKAPRDLFITLHQKNVTNPLASRRIHLAPGERAPVVLTFEPAASDAGSGLFVQLSPGDELAADDRAYGRVPAGRRLPVVFAPKDGSPWVRRALLADPHVELIGASVGSLNSADIPDDALVVIDGACPSATRGADTLILNPPRGPCRNAVIGAKATESSITSWSETDARLRFLTLDGVELLAANGIETQGPNEALVRTRSSTVIADVSSPGRSATLVGFDVGESNWPLKASFVLFVRNIVELARVHRAQGITGPARTGEPLRVRVPPDLQEVEVEGPEGQPSKVAARLGLAIVPEVGRAGFYHLSWQGARPGSVLVAANLTSESESDINPRDLQKAGQPLIVTAAKEMDDAFQDYTWILGALALLLVLLDVFWLTRKPPSARPLGTAPPPLPERAPRPRSTGLGRAA